MSGKPTYEELELKVKSLEKEALEKKVSEKFWLNEKGFPDLIFDSLPGIFYIFNEENKFLRWNRNFQAVSGYSAEEIAAMSPVDFFLGEDRRNIEAAIQEVFIKGTVSQEADFVSKSGFKTPHYFTGRLLKIDNENYVVGMGINITDRKKAEDALRESEQALKSAQHVAKIGSWRYNPKTQMPTWTEEMFHVFGLEPKPTALPYEAHRNIIHPDDWELFDTSVNRAVNEGIGYNLELRITRPDGEIRHVNTRCVSERNAEGTVIALIGTTQDITERKLSEYALRESEKRYKKILENVLVGVYQVTIDGKFIFANQKMIEMFGYSSFDELKAIGGIAELYVRSEDRPRIIDEIMSKGFINDEFEYRHKNGGSIWVRLHTRKTKNEEGAIILEGLMEDVTEIKKMEALVRQSQKMESIGNLAGGIAHDFNNILSAIIGFTELSLDEVEKGTNVENNLQEVYIAGKRAKDLVKQILAFARQSEEKTKPIRIDTITKEVLKFLRSSIPTSIKIDQQIKSESIILGNITQVHQVLMNLCTNAAHAMEAKGGVLKVELEDMVIDDGFHDQKPGLKPGNYLKLTVSDTGTGIKPDIIESIFEPYFTTKELGEGTGMGLAVVHGIIQTYGGHISVKSTLGKGSVFKIYLPITGNRRTHMEYITEGLPTGTERILFVDDEDPIVKMGSQILERLGYSVTMRTSSIEALKLFRSKPNDFDLVITDMTMPNMTGDQLAIELLAIKPDIPIIICTGYSKKLSDESAAGIGIKAFVYKPVVKADLSKTVRKVLDEAIKPNK